MVCGKVLTFSGAARGKVLTFLFFIFIFVVLFIIDCLCEKIETSSVLGLAFTTIKKHYKSNMSVSRQEKERSEQFTGALNEILDLIEDIIPHINENDYLKACNNLKLLNDLRNGGTVVQYVRHVIENVQSNEVVIEHERRALRKIRPEYIELTDSEKLSKGWKCCPKCDRIVKSLNIHKKSDVCRRTRESKTLSVLTTSPDINNKLVLIHKIRAWAIKTHRYRYY